MSLYLRSGVAEVFHYICSLERYLLHMGWLAIDKISLFTNVQ